MEFTYPDGSYFTFEDDEFFVYLPKPYGEDHITNTFDMMINDILDEAWMALRNRKEGQTVSAFLDEYAFTSFFHKRYNELIQPDEIFLQKWRNEVRREWLIDILSKVNNISTQE